jgi:hypothetical protein
LRFSGCNKTPSFDQHLAPDPGLAFLDLLEQSGSAFLTLAARSTLATLTFISLAASA